MHRLVGTEVVRNYLHFPLPLVAVACKALMVVVRLEVRSSVLLTPFDSNVCHFVVVGLTTFVKGLRMPLALVPHHYLLAIANRG